MRPVWEREDSGLKWRRDGGQRAVEALRSVGGAVDTLRGLIWLWKVTEMERSSTTPHF